MSVEQSEQKVLRQDIENFTVQICRADIDEIVGTGFVVSDEGHIVTCVHVVRDAGVEPRTHRRTRSFWTSLLERMFKSPQISGALTDAKDAEVGVYFPQQLRGERQDRRAVVVGCFPQHDDDVVVLQLQDGPTPLALQGKFARLGKAELSKDHPFNSYGYRRLGDFEGGWARGTIQGPPLDPPKGRKLQAIPVQLKSGQVNQGMSGAAVLDMHEERNLVVGVISEIWVPPPHSERDSSTCWAVNARVLSLEPLNLPLRDEPYPLGLARQPRTDIAAARARTNPQPGNSLKWAPPSLAKERWIGRGTLLQALNADWTDSECHVSELVGFGGEGKSSLARHWLDRLLNDRREPQPDGVFWWNCYDNRTVDALFEAALQYLSREPIELSSSSERVEEIKAMLGARRYLFILDGLEELQYQVGDAYGRLVNDDLRGLLEFFASPGHASFCLLTSRVPLVGLGRYLTFRPHKVERLSTEDGRTLLRKLGVTGPEAMLDRTVTDWNGHALTLSLLGSYLVERYRGNIRHIADLPAPIANEPHYERVQRLLHHYNVYLSQAERAFLQLLSAFRLPVPESALAPVFRTKSQDAADILTEPLVALDDTNFGALLKRLVKYCLLTDDAQTQCYNTHPLIRTYYAARLSERERSQIEAVHGRIETYYLISAASKSRIPTVSNLVPMLKSKEIPDDIKLQYLPLLGRMMPDNPTLSDLSPLIEAIHHACSAGDYDDIVTIYLLREALTSPLANQLSAFDTLLSVLRDFFPNGNTSQEPQTSNPEIKRFILSTFGLCLKQLGHLEEASRFYTRAIEIAKAMENWLNASINRQQVAEISTYLGEFTTSATSIREALNLAKQAQQDQPELSSHAFWNECSALALQAWIAHLQGDLRVAGTSFQQAEALFREIDPQKSFLYAQNGIWHAEYLRRTGETAYARQITEVNLKICASNGWKDEESCCHRLLGDLDAKNDQLQPAREHYNEALKIAESASRWVLIEALLAQGRFAARQGESEAAREYLEEARSSEYHRYAADIEVALAWAHHAMGDASATRTHAERAQSMSSKMGYYWGKVDAEEVLAAIEG